MADEYDDDSLLGEEEESILDELEENDSDDEDDKNSDDDNSEDDDELKISSFQDDFLSKDQIYRKLNEKKYYETRNFLTKYEKTRILGTRAEMIAHGAPTLVDRGDMVDPREMAKKEFDAGLNILIMKRPIPSKDPKNPIYEYRRLNH